MKEQILEQLKSSSNYLSGEQLSQQLGVTRAAVWKSIQQLRQEGYEIDAVRNRGYRLSSAGDVLTRNEILASLKQQGAGDLIDRLILVGSIDSTNRLARNEAEKGAPDLSFFVAERQTAGRGRRGRNWLSDNRGGLWLSILLRPDAEAGQMARITLFAGLCVTQALLNLGVPAGIKWPNDLVGAKSSRKLGGILTEMTAEETAITSLVIGIGINVGTDVFPEEISGTATSAKLEACGKIRRADLLAEIMQVFSREYPKYLSGGWLDNYREHCMTLGREVRVISSTGDTWPGRAVDLDDEGELIVEDQNGNRQVVRSGEVSVRGLMGYI